MARNVPRRVLSASENIIGGNPFLSPPQSNIRQLMMHAQTAHPRRCSGRFGRMPGSWRPSKLPRKHWIWPTSVAAAIVVMVARIVSTYSIFNDTADEPYHIGSAVSYCVAKHYIRGAQHPPLTRIVAGLPLMLAGVDSPRDRDVMTVQNDLTAFETGHAVLLHSKRSYWSVLTIARAAMLIFPIA